MLNNKEVLMQTGNIMEFLSHVPCGHMIFCSAAVDGVDFKTTIFIKLQEKLIKRLGYGPIFQIRAGLINIDGVSVLNMQVRINMSERLNFEAFLNYMMEDELPAFKEFSTMENINFVFYNERTELVTTIQVKNDTKDVVKAATEVAASFTPWSMVDFDKAKDKLMNTYSVIELWDKFRE